MQTRRRDSIEKNEKDNNAEVRSKLKRKQPWVTPELVDLGKDLSDVGGPIGPFSDGFGGRDRVNNFS